MKPHPSDPAATHVVQYEPAELPGIATMHCGATVAIQSDGSTVPAGFDFYLPEDRAKATCLACPVLAGLRTETAAK